MPDVYSILRFYCVLGRECETYARHMTKPDPRDGSILNFNSPEEQEAVEVVFNNAITPLAEVGFCRAWILT